MRQVVASLLVVGLCGSRGQAFQTRGEAAGGSEIKACSVLTRNMVEPLTQNKQILDVLPPEEETERLYTACEYGGVRLQLYVLGSSPASRSAPSKEFQALSGAGDIAFFRSNRDRYAELMVWSGQRYFTLQVSVPTGSTAEAVKPKTVTLANEIIAKIN